jgi:hypothetical protein
MKLPAINDLPIGFTLPICRGLARFLKMSDSVPLSFQRRDHAMSMGRNKQRKKDEH